MNKQCAVCVVSNYGQYKMQTADRVQNADQVQTADCRLSTKFRLTRQTFFFLRQKRVDIRFYNLER